MKTGKKLGPFPGERCILCKAQQENYLTTYYSTWGGHSALVKTPALECRFSALRRRKCHTAGKALGIVTVFHVSFKLCGHFPVPLLSRQLAANRKSLTATRAAPGNGVPINLFRNN
jgi:hypothetical protein